MCECFVSLFLRVRVWNIKRLGNLDHHAPSNIEGAKLNRAPRDYSCHFQMAHYLLRTSLNPVLILNRGGEDRAWNTGGIDAH